MNSCFSLFMNVLIPTVSLFTKLFIYCPLLPQFKVF